MNTQEVIPINIGDKVKEQRLKKGLTQEQLAQLLNVSRSTISGWEVGRNYPDIEMIVGISDLFGVSLDDLLRGDIKMTKDLSKRIRNNKFYKITLVVMVIVLILPLSSIIKLNLEEKNYRNNLSEYYWEKGKDVQSPDGYELTESGVRYSTYILRTGLNPIPLEERHPWVIAKKGPLVVEVKKNNQQFIAVSNSNDKTMKYTGRVEVTSQANIIQEDNDWSDKKKETIEKYINQHKDEYKVLLKKASEKRQQIVE